MNRKLPVKLATAAGALVLAGTVAASAADAPPEAADNGLTRASEHSGVDVPVRSGGAPSSDEDVSNDEDVRAEADSLETTDNEPAASTEDDGEELEVQGGGEHGAAVSDLASSKDPETSGRDHGEAVSTLAQQNGQGGERSAEARAGQDDDPEEPNADEHAARDVSDDDSED